MQNSKYQPISKQLLHNLSSKRKCGEISQVVQQKMDVVKLEQMQHQKEQQQQYEQQQYQAEIDEQDFSSQFQSEEFVHIPLKSIKQVYEESSMSFVKSYGDATDRSRKQITKRQLGKQVDNSLHLLSNNILQQEQNIQNSQNLRLSKHSSPLKNNFLSTKLKSLILSTLIQKHANKNRSVAKKKLVKWYFNACIQQKNPQKTQQHAIDNQFQQKNKIDAGRIMQKQKNYGRFWYKQVLNKILVSNKISQGRFLYSLKIMAQKQLNSKRFNLKNESKPGRHSHNRQKAMIQINKLFKNKQQKDIRKPNNTINERRNSKKDQSSINNILIDSSKMLEDLGNHQMKRESRIRSILQNQKCGLEQLSMQEKGSLSYIQPTNRDIHIQLITCTNIFQNSMQNQPNAQQNKGTLFKGSDSQRPGLDSRRLQATFLFASSLSKIFSYRVKNIFGIILNDAQQNSDLDLLQQDFQSQLLLAKRNLQLVELNYMVQLQLQTIAKNYEEQNQHLENIDKNVETLRGKFLQARMIGIMAVLKKILYKSTLLTGFQAIVSRGIGSRQVHNGAENRAKSNRTNFNNNNMYQVQQFEQGSSTSLSYKAGSARSINSYFTLNKNTYNEQNSNFLFFEKQQCQPKDIDFISSKQNIADSHQQKQKRRNSGQSGKMSSIQRLNLKYSTSINRRMSKIDRNDWKMFENNQNCSQPQSLSQKDEEEINQS